MGRATVVLTETPLLRRRGLYLAIIACWVALVGAAAWSAASALADGDPASDVLATESLFLPQDAGIPSAQLQQLGAIVQAAQRSGYPVRVALIASPTDLGSITELWNKPVSYARYLGQELSLTYQGLLLVVMPDGFGLYDQNRSLTQQQRALSGVSLQPGGPGLASAAEQSLKRLAATAGLSLAVPRTQAPGSTGSSDVIPWIVFALGLVLTGIAWAASLRARPLGSGRHNAPAS